MAILAQELNEVIMVKQKFNTGIVPLKTPNQCLA